MNRVFLLDRSGSMDASMDDTIGGFNSFVRQQVGLGGTLTLVQFDHEILEMYKNVPIGEVQPLTRETFCPRGSTALLDAMGSTIKGISEACTFIIFTDGCENASHKYTKAHIKDLVDQKTKDGWTFVYLGANQDAFAEAGSMGISSRHTHNFDSQRTPDAFRRLTQTCEQVLKHQTELEDSTQRRRTEPSPET